MATDQLKQNWKTFNALKPLFDHESVNHSVSEYVRDMAHTNGMESFWSMLKRGYVGIYHKMSPKHLDKYVTKFAHRHNVRGMVGKRLQFADLIADNGLALGARS